MTDIINMTLNFLQREQEKEKVSTAFPKPSEITFLYVAVLRLGCHATGATTATTCLRELETYLNNFDSAYAVDICLLYTGWYTLDDLIRQADRGGLIHPRNLRAPIPLAIRRNTKASRFTKEILRTLYFPGGAYFTVDPLPSEPEETNEQRPWQYRSHPETPRPRAVIIDDPEAEREAEALRAFQERPPGGLSPSLSPFTSQVSRAIGDYNDESPGRNYL